MSGQYYAELMTARGGETLKKKPLPLPVPHFTHDRLNGKWIVFVHDVESDKSESPVIFPFIPVEGEYRSEADAKHTADRLNRRPDPPTIKSLFTLPHITRILRGTGLGASNAAQVADWANGGLLIVAAAENLALRRIESLAGDCAAAKAAADALDAARAAIDAGNFAAIAHDPEQHEQSQKDFDIFRGSLTQHAEQFRQLAKNKAEDIQLGKRGVKHMYPAFVATVRKYEELSGSKLKPYVSDSAPGNLGTAFVLEILQILWPEFDCGNIRTLRRMLTVDEST